MGLETATFISDLVTTNPVGASDPKSQGDDHLRLLKTVLQATFPDASRSFRFGSTISKTTAYTILTSDENSLILADATAASFVITLPAGISLSIGFKVSVVKVDSTVNTVTVDGNGAETINGATNSILTFQYNLETYIWTGTEWFVAATAALPSGIGTVTGELKLWAINTAPTGWLICDGKAVSRTTYDDLFAVVGTVYGVGDGATTFNLPDMRGKVVVGGNNASTPNGVNSSLTTRELAATGGEETHVLVVSEMPAHRHLLFADESGSLHPATVSSAQQVQRRNFAISNQEEYSMNGTSTEATVGRSSSTGSDGAHNNMQPFTVINYIIKT